MLVDIICPKSQISFPLSVVCVHACMRMYFNLSCMLNMVLLINFKNLYCKPDNF